MNLYLATRWGNDNSADGPNGDDTHFLVKASNVDEAAKLVDQVLEKMPHTKVNAYCHRMTRIGISISTNQKAAILSGPYIAPIIMHGDESVDYSERWVRNYLEEEWVAFSDYYEV